MTTRAGQRKKSIEEVVGYALSHRIRVQTLTLLNEGTYTPDQIAKLIGEPLNKVSHHIKSYTKPAPSNSPRSGRHGTQISISIALSRCRSTPTRKFGACPRSNVR